MTIPVENLKHLHPICRFKGYDESRKNAGESMSYSDLDRLSKHETPEPTDYYMPELMSGSDYSGEAITVSNHRLFLERRLVDRQLRPATGGARRPRRFLRGSARRSAQGKRTKRMIAYHFTGKTLRDGRPLPPAGEWLEHDGEVKMCQSGLHASKTPWDALQYAPGEYLHRVECDGVVKEQSDKLVCRRRKIIATIDATQLLREFARKQALSVIHLWDAPDVVKQYLETGNEELRAAARAAAAAADAARAAARDAAWAATRAATRATAMDAAMDAFNSLVESAFAKGGNHAIL